MIDHKPLAGVINPYALAELSVGRPINWSRVADPPRLLEETLGVEHDRLFDPAHRAVPYALAPEREALEVEPEAWTHRLQELERVVVPEEGRLDLRTFDENAAALALRRLEVAGVEGLRPEAQERMAAAVVPVQVASNDEEFTPPGAAWIDPGDFFEEGTEFADPVQGSLGDCYFIAALASVAWSRPYTILQRNRATGHSQQEFVNQIAFTRNGSADSVEVTERVPLRGSNTLYARSSEAGEIWPAVYEKAYAKWRTGNDTDKPPYGPLHGGDPVRACCELVEGLRPTSKSTRRESAADLYSFVRQNSLSRRTVNPMTAWTYGRASDAPDSIQYDAASGIVGWHAYSVFGWDFVRGRRHIVLRNPWGRHEGRVGTRSGTWVAHETSFWRRVPLDTGGVFSMDADEFKRYFAGIGVAK